MAHYEFRKVTSIYDLHRLFQLRYQVYREENLGGFIKESPFKIDLDRWDCYSDHYGLYYVDGDQEKIVGNLRVVRTIITATGKLIGRAYRKYYEYHQVSERLTTVLPFSGYCQIDEEQLGPYFAIKKGRDVCEASRLFISSKHRHREVVKNFIEAAITVAFYSQGLKSAFFSCTSLHSRMYRHYGGQILPGSEQIIQSNASQLSVVVVLEKSNIPSDIAKRLECRSQEYNLTAKILLNAISFNEISFVAA